MKNKEVDVFGTKYSIIYANKVTDVKEQEHAMDNCNEGDVLWGITDHDHKQIVISTKTILGKPRDKEDMERTLYHELIHAILVSGQYLQSNSDEALVEWLARCIYSLKQQKIL